MRDREACMHACRPKSVCAVGAGPTGREYDYVALWRARTRGRPRRKCLSFAQKNSFVQKYSF